MMRLTKFEHSALVAQIGTSALIIDPGMFTTPLTDVDSVVAVVITHEHADHWTPEHLNRILERNPDARFFGPAGVVAASVAVPVERVQDGDVIEVGPFTLAFYGSRHAVIHETVPTVDNVGVMVNDVLYYAGDSYTVPPVPVNTLAVPIGAPWLKIGDAMDYVTAIAPKRSFPVHEMVLSQIGKTMTHDRIRTVTERGGGEFTVLETGESLEL